MTVITTYLGVYLSENGGDKFITIDYLQHCRREAVKALFEED